MTNFRTVRKPSKDLTAEDILEAEPTVKVRSVVAEGREDEQTKKTERAWIMYFEGEAKGVRMNRTNCLLISKLTEKVAGLSKDDSEHVEAWIGRWVTLGARPTRFGGEDTMGIRIIGSPELKQPLDLRLKLGNRRENHRLLPTRRQAASNSPPARSAPASSPPAIRPPPSDWGNTGTGAPELDPDHPDAEKE